MGCGVSGGEKGQQVMVLGARCHHPHPPLCQAGSSFHCHGCHHTGTHHNPLELAPPWRSEPQKPRAGAGGSSLSPETGAKGGGKNPKRQRKAASVLGFTCAPRAALPPAVPWHRRLPPEELQVPPLLGGPLCFLQAPRPRVARQSSSCEPTSPKEGGGGGEGAGNTLPRGRVAPGRRAGTYRPAVTPSTWLRRWRCGRPGEGKLRQGAPDGCCPCPRCHCVI